MVSAWRRREDLPDAHREDVRSALGWAYATDDVRAGATVTDRWLVLGSHRTDTGRLLEQRTWFHGLDTGERVVVLDFAAGGQALPVAQLTGAVVRATLALYPGSAPRRALVVGDPEPVAAAGSAPGERDVATALPPWPRRGPSRRWSGGYRWSSSRSHWGSTTSSTSAAPPCPSSRGVTPGPFSPPPAATPRPASASGMRAVSGR